MEYRAVNSDRVDELNVRSIIGAHRMFFAAEQHERCGRYIASVGNHSVTIEYPGDFISFMIEYAWRR